MKERSDFLMKYIFWTIIGNQNFNSSAKQDASEALNFILIGLYDQGTYENIFTTSFGFCTYTYR